MNVRGWMVMGALAGAAALSACASTKTAPAPSVSVPTDIVGRFVWHDLVTNDIAASQKFYGALLGWEFESTTRVGRPYVIARSGGRPTGGIVLRKEGRTGPATWLAYLSVADLDEALARVTSARGQVVLPPTVVGEYGRVAVILDPEGAPLGLIALTGTVAAEPAQPPMNGFFWMEHLARDVPAALVFDKALAGYESTVSTSDRGIEYTVLKRERSRAGLLQIPAELSGVQPNWLPYVRVEDPAALAARVESLGGKVVIAPRGDIRDGTLAVITDPTGAALALQKWPL